MTQLVITDGKLAITDSQIIARSLAMRHKDVMRVVDQFLDDYPDLRVIQNPPKLYSGIEYIHLEQRHYRGKDFTAAVMNRECFSLLFMRFETQRARQMQREFVKAFFEMEKRLQQSEKNGRDPAWIASRESGKVGDRKSVV